MWMWWGGDGGGEVGVESGFVDVGEVGTELVIFLRGDRIVFVIVAAAALHGEAEEGGAEGVESIGNILDAEFFGDASAFDFLWVESVEGGGEELITFKYLIPDAASRDPVSLTVVALENSIVVVAQ